MILDFSMGKDFTVLNRHRYRSIYIQKPEIIKTKVVLWSIKAGVDTDSDANPKPEQQNVQ